MPTYQYVCTDCGPRFELVQSFTDAPASECPECGAPVRKVYSSVGVVFKGSGFYRNDSRDSARSTDAAKSDSKSETSSSGRSKSSDAKSSDSKPAKSGDSSSSSSSSSSAGKSDSKSSSS